MASRIVSGCDLRYTSGMDTDDKVCENRLRRMAARQGLRLTTNGRRDPFAQDYLARYTIEPGPSGLTLDEAEAWLKTPPGSRGARMNGVASAEGLPDLGHDGPDRRDG